MPRDSGSSPRSSAWFIFAFVGGVVIVLMSISFVQEVRRRVVLQQHVQELQREIREREQRIADLNNLTEYLRTNAYLERAAREKLSYQRPGEHAVVVPESGHILGAEELTEEIENRNRVPIPLQWWNLLFPPGPG